MRRKRPFLIALGTLLLLAAALWTWAWFKVDACLDRGCFWDEDLDQCVCQGASTVKDRP